jgi:IS30 family transposase
MERTYSQIGLEERCEIARLCDSGKSIRQVAAALDRAPSTIAREIRRNRSRQSGYLPGYANEQSRARRWTGSMLDRQPELREMVIGGLAKGLSPELVAGRLAVETGQKVISYETIYRFIYAQIARTKDFTWRHLLPRGRARRSWRGCKRGKSASSIPLRCPISARPKSAKNRKTPGHWESDLMNFRKPDQSVLILHERRSRLMMGINLPAKDAATVAQAMCDLLAPLPRAWRQTITFDNGPEFGQHYRLHDHGTETYFCDTYSPWQKGGIENGIGRLRRRLPRHTDLSNISAKQLTRLFQHYNNTPRKCLDFLTPAEFFWHELLHFKCESSPGQAGE